MSLSALAERSITFYSKGQPPLLLEGVVNTPSKAEQAPVVVLCHPQPASSNMNDSLTAAIAQSLGEAGMITLRFNFRGVGLSQGQQTDGRLEPLDLAGAIRCCHQCCFQICKSMGRDAWSVKHEYESKQSDYCTK